MPNEIAESFMRGYLTDHFMHKALLLADALRRGSDDLPPGMFDGADPKKWELSLKLDLRATHFQAIEALFQLVRALYPRDPGGHVDFDMGQIRDDDLWLNLSRRKLDDTAKHVREIGKGGELPFDRWHVGAEGADTGVPFLRHVFYYGIPVDEETERSLPVIRDALVTLAKEFNDRGEYNAYKHGMRIVPTVGRFEFWSEEDPGRRATYDLQHSATYLDPYDPDGTAHVTRPLDSERDLRMIEVCHALVSNVVRSRRRHIPGLGHQPIYVLSTEKLAAAERRSGQLARLTWLERDGVRHAIRISYYVHPADT
ncbi:hypothetical protein [Rubrivirga sp. IMCC43871]|uniref:hypothetical protein n=1 Tax=Rubrivirga sp. IMCC43871 TaxID=3391575 RepID=UPI00398F9096